ncbi:MAG: hypothetical protein ACJ8C4_09160 [Gemmataceae bacterium]
MLALAAGVAVIAGIIWLGGLAHDDLALVVDQLDVPTPPGMSRAVFLAEIQHESNLPRRLNRNDPKTAEALKNAFSKHPWVESVEISDLMKAQPVVLTLRTPTLAVAGRVLDREGVLLPRRAPIIGLPDYRGAINSQTGESGQPFGDPAVRDVAKRIGWLEVQVPEIHWQSAEITADGLILTRDDGAKAIWGKDASGEPTAEAKAARLRAWPSGDIDLRK